MPSQSKLKVAVLGTGSVGLQHYKALLLVEGIQPVAIPIRAGRIAELEASGITTAATLEEAVAQGVTRVVIASDTRRHPEDAQKALGLGCHVLLEKPLAVGLGQTVSLGASARSAGRHLFVGCVLRFSESLNVFRSWLPRLGRLHSVRIVCQSYLPQWRPQRSYRDSYSARADEGGVLRDLIHEIDYAGWIFGWPTALYAKLRNLGRLDIQSEETADLLWEIAPCATLSMNLDYLSRPAARGIRANGENGTMEWNAISRAVQIDLGTGTLEHFASAQTREEMFVSQAEAFMGSCEGRLDVRLAGLEDGIRAVAVCDAARHASAEKREVPVNYP